MTPDRRAQLEAEETVRYQTRQRLRQRDQLTWLLIVIAVIAVLMVRWLYPELGL